jgi:hypothetical protein
VNWFSERRSKLIFWESEARLQSSGQSDHLYFQFKGRPQLCAFSCSVQLNEYGGELTRVRFLQKRRVRGKKSKGLDLVGK